ncbi:hypothetical protein ACLB2K_029425 [Fragaria x ananassa]
MDPFGNPLPNDQFSNPFSTGQSSMVSYGQSSSTVPLQSQIDGLKGLSGQLELYNVDEQEPTATQEHYMTTDIEWDPTGSYFSS